MRMYADADGQTRLSELQGPGLTGIPATTVDLPASASGRPGGSRPGQEFHPAPRRQLVVPLQGVFEIVTTAGDRARFGAGDCLLADDVGTTGHTVEHVSDEPVVVITVGVDAGWEAPDPGGPGGRS